MEDVKKIIIIRVGLDNIWRVLIIQYTNDDNK